MRYVERQFSVMMLQIRNFMVLYFMMLFLWCCFYFKCNCTYDVHCVILTLLYFPHVHVHLLLPFQCCRKCERVFSDNEQKHHCRSCGKGFCDNCSTNKRPVPERGWGDVLVRVCDKCYKRASISGKDYLIYVQVIGTNIQKRCHNHGCFKVGFKM